MGHQREGEAFNLIVMISGDSSLVQELQKELMSDFVLKAFPDTASVQNYFDHNLYEISMVLLGEDLPVDEKREILRSIKEHPSYSSVPVVIISNQEATMADEQLLLQGAVDVIRLPQNKVLLNKRLHNDVRVNDSATYDEINRMLSPLPSNIWLKDTKGRYIFATHYWHHLDQHGDPTWTIRGKTDAEIRKDRENANEAMQRDRELLEKDQDVSYIIEVNTDNKHEYYKVDKAPIHDDLGKITGIVGMVSDVTEEEQLRRSLEQSARYDSLTGVLSRQSYDAYIEELKERNAVKLSFIIADCNNLKGINDTYGHQDGNEYIKMASLVFRNVVPKEYPIFRIGGDEFAAVLENIPYEKVHEFVHAIEEEEKKFQIRTTSLSMAVGSSYRPDAGISIDECLALADRDMYRNKVRMKRLPEQDLEKGRLGGEAFGAFLEALNHGDYSMEAIAPAVAELAEQIGIARLDIRLNQPPNYYTPQGEKHETTLYQWDGAVAETPDYTREFHSGEGGTVLFHAYTRQEDGIFTLAQRADIDEIVLVLMMHAARFRLIGKVEQNAMTNYLSGLPNSGGYIREIGKRVAMHQIQNYVAMHFNLRGFGRINQQFGSQEGDECVRRYSRAVYQSLWEGEVLSHFGGDNFAALILKEHVSEFLKLLGGVQIYGVRDGQKIPIVIRAAVGAFPIPEAAEPKEILDCSTAALSIARTKGQDLVVMTPEMHRRITMSKVLANEFPKALATEQFQVYYQPKIDTRSGEIIGAEALVRWKRGETILEPIAFVPMLERNGQLLDLDLYMLRHVCDDIRNWRERSHDCVPVSVNFSRRDICGMGRTAKGTAQMICQVIEDAGIETELIIIEVTETMDADEQRQLFEFLAELRSVGIRTSVDDFGTGYSSLSVLRDFPISEIKIDRSFIDHNGLGVNDEIILQNIVSMAKGLGLNIISEGVENREQVRFLQRMGCYAVQGFLYDRPLSRDEWEIRLAAGPYTVGLETDGSNL